MTENFSTPETDVSLDETSKIWDIQNEAEQRGRQIEVLLPQQVKDDLKSRENTTIIDAGAGRGMQGTIAITPLLNEQSKIEIHPVEVSDYPEAPLKEAANFLNSRYPMSEINPHYGQTLQDFSSSPETTQADVLLLSQTEWSSQVSPDIYDKLVKPGGYIIELGINKNIQGLESKGFQVVNKTETSYPNTENVVWQKAPIQEAMPAAAD